MNWEVKTRIILRMNTYTLPYRGISFGRLARNPSTFDLGKTPSREWQIPLPMALQQKDSQIGEKLSKILLPDGKFVYRWRYSKRTGLWGGDR